MYPPPGANGKPQLPDRLCQSENWLAVPQTLYSPLVFPHHLLRFLQKKRCNFVTLNFLKNNQHLTWCFQGYICMHLCVWCGSVGTLPVSVTVSCQIPPSFLTQGTWTESVDGEMTDSGLRKTKRELM